MVMPFRGRDIRMMGEIRTRVGAPFPMDLLVWTPERAKRTDYFAREIVAGGKVMYES